MDPIRGLESRAKGVDCIHPVVDKRLRMVRILVAVKSTGFLNIFLNPPKVRSVIDRVDEVRRRFSAVVK